MTADDRPVQIPVDLLDPHPDNPRIVRRDDVISSITAAIRERGEFDPAHAILVRPMGDRFQVVSGHNRLEAAIDAVVDTVPAWVRDMNDDEAFMQLVLANAQGELSALEIGMHALAAVPKGKGGRGIVGGLSEYAEAIHRARSRVSEMRSAAEVYVETRPTWDRFADADPVDYARHQNEISKAPQEAWPVLVETLIERGWSLADTQHWVSGVREIAVPPEWAWWLPMDVLASRYLREKKWGASAVARLVAAADGVLQWIAENIDDIDERTAARRAFAAWLTNEGQAGWHAREVSGWLARLIASRLIAEEEDAEAPGWYFGRWQDYVDKLDDGSVSLLLTDPPYGMGYQSNMRLDTRQPKRHDKIEGDDSPEAATAGMIEMLKTLDVKLADDAHIVIFCTWRGEPALRELVEDCGYTVRGSWVWDKMITGTGDLDGALAPEHERMVHATKGRPRVWDRRGDVFHVARPDAVRHPTEKPQPLLEEVIDAITVDGQLVADPFGGVASTAAAARAMGRQWWSCEMREDYFEIGSGRLT